MIPGHIINTYLSTQGEMSDKFEVGPYRVEMFYKMGGGHIIIWHKDEEEPDGTLDGCDFFIDLEDMEEEYRQPFVVIY
jgi:hypothetical protein